MTLKNHETHPFVAQLDENEGDTLVSVGVALELLG
jgi:hypothetical protein